MKILRIAALLAAALAFLGIAQVKVLPLGDSQTAGAGGQCYRPWLEKLIHDANQSCRFVFVGEYTTYGDPAGFDPTDAYFYDHHHSGVIGCFITAMKARFSALDASMVPDVALVAGGTNDIGDGRFWETCPGHPTAPLLPTQKQINAAAGVVRDSMKALITALRQRNPSMKIVLAQIALAPDVNTMTVQSPCNTNLCEPCLQSWFNPVVKVYDSLLSVMASHMSTSASPIVVVDLRAGIDLASDFQDSHHPNLSCAQKWGQLWYDGLMTACDRATNLKFANGKRTSFANKSMRCNFFPGVFMRGGDAFHAKGGHNGSCLGLSERCDVNAFRTYNGLGRMSGYVSIASREAVDLSWTQFAAGLAGSKEGCDTPAPFK